MKQMNEQGTELHGPPEETGGPAPPAETPEEVAEAVLADVFPEEAPAESPAGENSPEEAVSGMNSPEGKPPEEVPEETDRKKRREKKPPRDKPQEKPPKEKSALKALLFLLLKLAIVAGIGYLALLYVFGVFRLAGNNMYPMLKDGDLCITYKLEEYHSQDVVAYRVDGEIHLGRIVARHGDILDGDEMGLLLNGGHPSEEIFYPTQIQDTALELPISLGDGEYVVLNDFRDDLSDSRVYGVINEDSFEGKVIFIFRRRGF